MSEIQAELMAMLTVWTSAGHHHGV